MIAINREELAWAAGFYEGEGCISRSVNQLHVTVVQVDREPLDRFARALGFGRVALHRRSKQRNPNHKPCYRWRVTNFEQAQATVAMLWYWLSERRREQARSALLTRRARPLRTHCKNGHELTAQNVSLARDGYRICRECRRNTAREQYRAKRGTFVGRAFE